MTRNRRSFWPNLETLRRLTIGFQDERYRRTEVTLRGLTDAELRFTAEHITAELVRRLPGGGLR